MSWYLWLSISVILISFATLLQRVVSRDSKLSPSSLSILTLWLISIGMWAITAVRGFQFSLSELPILGVLLSTVLYSAGNILKFAALREVTAAHFTVVYASRAIWTAIIAILFVDGSFSLLQLLGVLVLAVAIITVTHDGEKFAFDAGFTYTILAGFAVGTAFGNDANILQDGLDIITYSTLLTTAVALTMSLARPRAILPAYKSLADRRFFRQMIGLSGFYVFAPVTFMYAIQVESNSAVVVALNQTQTILIVIGAAVFLRERERIGQKMLGAALSFVGVLLVIS